MVVPEFSGVERRVWELSGRRALCRRRARVRVGEVDLDAEVAQTFDGAEAIGGGGIVADFAGAFGERRPGWRSDAKWIYRREVRRRR